MTRALLLLSIAVSSSLPLAVAAQDCVEGRERVDGFCCWPGQTFSSMARRCEGAPHCPDALVEHGEECVVPLFIPVPGAPTDASLPPSEAFGLSPPVEPPPSAVSTTSDWPAVHDGETVHRAVHRNGEDGGLVAAALVVFDIGWAMGLLVGMIDTAGRYCTAFGSGAAVPCNSGGFALIPVGGGIFAGLTNFPTVPGRRSEILWGFALGIPSVLLQCIGLVSLAVALANEVNDIGTPEIGTDDGVSVAFVPGVQGGDVGASAVVTF